MASEYESRVNELIAAVGEGPLVSRVEVAQPYAIPQERGYWETGPLAGHAIRNHPGGGQTHAMRDSVIPHADDYMRRLAEGLITESGSDIISAAEDNAEAIARRYSELAPVKTGVLRGSTHPQVLDDGVVVYDRPPAAPSGGSAL
jgi:hypothetical protein